MFAIVVVSALAVALFAVAIGVGLEEEAHGAEVIDEDVEDVARRERARRRFHDFMKGVK